MNVVNYSPSMLHFLRTWISLKEVISARNISEYHTFHGYGKKINIIPYFRSVNSSLHFGSCVPFKILFFPCIVFEPGESKFASVQEMAVDRSIAFKTTMNKQE